MHRHGYKGRKFGREKDPREALLKGQADSLFLNESITTTLPKAKSLKSYSEKLITKAKKGGLHNRRQIISSLQTEQAANKLVDEIALKLTARSSGYLKIEKLGERRGDNASLAKLLFVDDLTKIPVEKKSTKSTKPPTKKAPKPTKKTSSTKKEAK